MKNPLHIVVGLVFVLLGTALGFGVHAQALSFLAGCLLVFVALVFTVRLPAVVLPPRPIPIRMIRRQCMS